MMNWLKKKRVWIPLLIVVILLVTYFSGPIPDDPVYAFDWVKVPDSAEQLENYLSEKQDTLPIREDNEARIIWADSLRQKTEYSFIYLHGFAGSYRDGYPVNVNVADTFNANIFLSRWAGHGLEPPHSLQNFTPENAWNSAKEALAIGHKIGDKVIIMSTSTGGTLGIMLAAIFPDSVHALINMSPNIREDEAGAFLLNSPWGYDIAHLVSFGDHKKVYHKKEIARQYWDTLYPSDALIELQSLVESTMMEDTYELVECPVITLYYYKNFFEEDERVEIDDFPEIMNMFSTPDSLIKIQALSTPGTHFIGSDIKSEDYKSTQEEIIEFCRETLKMELQKKN